MENPMVRRIVGVIAGVIVGGLVVFLVEAAGHSLFPPPPGTDMTDPEDMKRLIASLPGAALVMVLAGWFIGSFAAAYVASIVARTPKVAWVVAAIFIALTSMNFVMIPHPLWMVAAGIAIPLLTAWLVTMMRPSADRA